MRACHFLIIAFAVLASAESISAQTLTTAQRREITTARNELSRVGVLIRFKKGEEAAKLFNTAQARIAKVAKDAKLKSSSRLLIILNRQLTIQRAQIEKLGVKLDAPTAGGGGKKTVSFVKDVAPIIVRRCTRCHGRSGNLDLGSFAGIERGGRSRGLIVAGDPAKSLLIQRLKAVGPLRMPKNGQALPQAEINTLSKWIEEGATFDGNGKAVALNRLKSASEKPDPKKPKPTVTVLKPTGKETVSFTKDIAPFMVNICLRCHSGNNPRGGFSMETFEKLLVGGNSGRVVVPGDLNGSRLWDLAGKQRPIKMPPGQLLITRTNHKNLRTWISEGARFDGKDAKAALRSLVPTEEELKAAKFLKMTPEQMATHRKKQSDSLWKKAMSGETAKTVETKELVLYGSVSKARLDEVSKWAEGQLAFLKKTFSQKGDAKSGRLFRGKLAVFVVKDRYAYEDFFFNGFRRQPSKEQVGHSKVDSNYEDAYIVVQDVGDEIKETKANLKLNVMDSISLAFFDKFSGSGTLPDWIKRGAGLAFAYEKDRQNVFLQNQFSIARDMLKTVNTKKPEEVFDSGKFSPAGSRAVGMTLVRFFLKGGGAGKFASLVKDLKSGTKFKDAVQKAYRASPKALAYRYARTLPRK